MTAAVGQSGAWVRKGSRRWLPLVAVLFGVGLVVGAPASASAAVSGVAWAVPAADRASAFKVDYFVNRDGSLDVTQHISWEFPSGGASHGIERNIKVRAGYQDREDVYRYYELSEVSAASPSGAPSDISITDFGAFKRVRIGSPSRTVSGIQQYVVKFHLANYVNGVSDTSAEFYYNLIDPSNNDEYRNVSATLRGPAPSERTDCFYGERGASSHCTSKPGATATFSAPDARPGEGVSVLASFPRAAFGELAPDLREGDVGNSSESSISPRTQRLAGFLALGAGGLLPLLAAGLMGLLIWQRGRDEQYAGLTPGLSPGVGEQAQTVLAGRSPTTAVQFTPPAGVQPGMLGTVLDEEANVVDVSATLIDLAVRGYLTLGEVEGQGLFKRPDWLLTRKHSPATASLAPYEQALLDGVFASGDTTYLSDLKNTFAPTLRSVQNSMYEEVVARGWFRRSPQDQRGGWMGFGKVLMVGGFILIWVLAFGGFGRSVLGDSGFPFPPTVALGVGVLASGAIIHFLGKRMASRTAEGSAVLAQSLGFRQYLVTAEANQIKFEEAQDIFGKVLPYAIVFGVADRWARTFDQVATAAQAAGHPIGVPIWYVGSFDSNGFGNLAASMDSFSTTAAGTFVSTPGSSGSSGFSTGGGFSGGGGGGDSGGSW